MDDANLMDCVNGGLTQSIIRFAEYFAVYDRMRKTYTHIVVIVLRIEYLM